MQRDNMNSNLKKTLKQDSSLVAAGRSNGPSQSPAISRSGQKLRVIIAAIPYRVRTDEDLMRFAGRGDECAFDEIVRRHRGRIYGFACGVLDEARAASVMKVAFVSAYRDRESKDSIVDVKAWLLVHAARALMHAVRDRHEQRLLERSAR